MGVRCEPSLDEVLGDAAVRLLMASDGVSEAALRALLGRVRRDAPQAAVAAKLPAPPWCCPAL